MWNSTTLNFIWFYPVLALFKLLNERLKKDIKTAKETVQIKIEHLKNELDAMQTKILNELDQIQKDFEELVSLILNFLLYIYYSIFKSESIKA